MNQPRSKRVLVLGCGVSGLSCALELQAAGYAVRIVARELPPATTSDVAAAVWHPFQAHPFERVKYWSEITYTIFEGLAGVPQSGVDLVTLAEWFRQPLDPPWWVTQRHGVRRLLDTQMQPGFVSGYTYRVPMADTSLYIPYLINRFRSLGGRIEQREIKHFEHALEDEDLIVNCTGLGSVKLALDGNLFPLRGQVVRVSRRQHLPHLVEEEDPLWPLYILPRRHDCILGGTLEQGRWDLTPDPESTHRILTHCKALCPDLDGLEVLEVKVGLRPGRHQVRLELERGVSGIPIIHNYGHGGSGFTLSWGCAAEVLRLARSVVQP